MQRRSKAKLGKRVFNISPAIIAGLFLYIYRMTAEEWEAQFHGRELPTFVQFASGMSTSDVPAFLESSLRILRAGNARVSEPIEWRLQIMLDQMNKAEQNETT